jgi:V/A-type H+-transporting ATPase subunit E
MSVDELRRAVLEKARSEAEAIIRKAEDEAARIVEEAVRRKKAVVEQKKEELLRNLNPDAKIAEARSKARLLVAGAKSAALREIRDLAVSVLSTLPRDKRLESVKRLVDEAIAELLGTLDKVSSVVIKVSKGDAVFSDYIKRYVEDKYKIEVEGVYGVDILGGVIVECLGGEVAVDNSYDGRLEKVVRAVASQLLVSGR